MTELKVGDRIKDNDPRMCPRVLTVKRIWWPTTGDPAAARAIAHDAGGRPFTILLRRIHLDGKPRRTGFSRVEQP